MPETMLTAQNLKAAAAIFILVAAIYSFIRERISPDLTALLAVLALLLTGVLTPSGLIGRTLREARFAETYDTIVVALRRRWAAVGRTTTIPPLHAGDILVVEGRREAMDALAGRKGFLVIRDVARPEQQTGKILITLLTLVAVILSVSLGLVPIVTAAVAGCAVLILTKCLNLREMYQAIDMSIVVLLAGSLALGGGARKNRRHDSDRGRFDRFGWNYLPELGDFTLKIYSSKD